MALFKGYAGPRGAYDREYQIFRTEEPGMVRYPSGLGNMCIGEVIELGSDVTTSPNSRWRRTFFITVHFGKSMSR